MATFEFTAYEARDGRSVVFRIGQKPLFPSRTVEAKTPDEALAAFDAYKRAATETGLHLAVRVDVAGGSRAPNGWKAVKATLPPYQFVNSPA